MAEHELIKPEEGGERTTVGSLKSQNHLEHNPGPLVAQ